MTTLSVLSPSVDSDAFLFMAIYSMGGVTCIYTIWFYEYQGPV